GAYRLPWFFQLLASGVLRAGFSTDASSGATQHYCESGALTDDQRYDATLVFDAVDAELRLYIDGALTATNSNPGADDFPWQAPGAYLLVGVGTGGAMPGAAEGDSTLDGGAIDNLFGIWLPGADIDQELADGLSILETVLKHRRQTWMNPEACAFHYGFDGTSSTEYLRDATDYENDLLEVGTLADHSSLVNPAMPGNYVRHHDFADGSRELVVIAGGDLFVQSMRRARE
ncbi:MAG TPA: hypothetical protein VFH61_12475, partial [Thermoleophilia bacterium]|nr:hypothetical protein [Thermoleophilia bacterium]